MKTKTSKLLEVIIESINYIILCYALSNVAVLLKSNPIFILFFASEMWVTGNYWRKVLELTKSKVFSGILLIVCFAIHIGMIYFIGRIIGDVVPYYQH